MDGWMGGWVAGWLTYIGPSLTQQVSVPDIRIRQRDAKMRAKPPIARASWAGPAATKKEETTTTNATTERGAPMRRKMPRPRQTERESVRVKLTTAEPSGGLRV